MKIITAIGNEEINEKLKKDTFYDVVGKDLQYQDGIFEILDTENRVDVLILKFNLVGDLNKYDLIEKIKEKKPNIKIIIILEKENKKLEEFLYFKKINNILYNNEKLFYQINNILKNNSSKNKLLENKKEKNILLKKPILNNQKINKTITIIGDKKCGKTIFIILISKLINKKILIINLNNKNKEINILLGIKYKKEEFLKINKKIDLITCDEKSLIRKDLKNIFKQYDYIFLDIPNINDINQFRNIKEITEIFILLVEPNLIGVNNSKEILSKIINKEKIEDKKIKIIINKDNYFAINKIIIKNIFNDYEIIGKINQNSKYHFLINNNFNLIDLKIKKEYLKIIKKVECL